MMMGACGDAVSRLRRWWWLLALVALIAGCPDRPATQIIVHVDSDPSLAGQILRVDVRAYFEGSPGRPVIGDAGYDLAARSYALPGDVSIVPSDLDESRKLFVEVTARTSFGELTQRAALRFNRGHQVWWFVQFTRGCVGVPCPSGQSCGNEGRCRLDTQVPVSEQPPPSTPSDVTVLLADVAAEPIAPMDIADVAAEPTEDATSELPLDASTPDVELDAPPDVELDAPPDVGLDAPPDVELDAPPDVAADSTSDVTVVDAVDTPVSETPLVCDPGTADCDGVATNGCEITLATSRTHCGACGVVCASTTPACVSGVCERGPFPSDGREGAYEPGGDGGTAPIVVVLPAGVHQFTTINIRSNVTVRTDTTGVLDLRATGDVLINGVIDVSGGAGARTRGSNSNTQSQGGTTGTAVAGTTTPGCTSTAASGGVLSAGRDGMGPCPGIGGRFGGGGGGSATQTGECGVMSSGGGGGGGAAGGGGGAGVAQPGGEGGSIPGRTQAGSGGTTTGGRAGGGESTNPRVALVYRGFDAPTRCPDTCGGGGGGSIGAVAANDLAVTQSFTPGSGGGGGGSTICRGGNGSGGGGGGGALRVASYTRITLGGALNASGGAGGFLEMSAGGGGGGSGGVVYLSAPELTVTGDISTVGGQTPPDGCRSGGVGGLGRIRFSAIESRCLLGGRFDPPVSSTTGCAPSPMGGVAGETYVARWPD